MKRNLVRLTTIAAIFCMAACHSLSTQDQETYDRGLDAMKAGTWKGAIGLFTAVVETNRDYSPAYLGRGHAYFELGDYDKALEDLDQALAHRRLSKDETFDALLCKGRGFIEIGRKQFALAKGAGSSQGSRRRQQARTSFVHANSLISSALKQSPARYEGLVWRAYCYLRLENHRRALELLRNCEKIAPDRWEHRFFKALAIEDVYELSAESLNIYLEITSSGPRSELTPLYEHLATILPKVHKSYQPRILERLEDFAIAVPDHSPKLDALLKRTRAQLKEEEREAERRLALKRAAKLAADQQFKAALSLLEKLLATRDDAQISDLIRQIKENWSLRLEAEAIALSSSEDKQKLGQALEYYRSAQKLTSQVDRLGQLQQRINALQLVLTRRATSQKLRKCYALLKKGQSKQVLTALSRIPVDSLVSDEKDFYYYLRGVSNYRIKNWRSAVLAFERITHRQSRDLDLLHGLALVHTGQKEKGVQYLLTTREEQRDDNVHKIMGEHFLEKKEYEDALVHLDAIKKPSDPDYELRVKARENLGMKAYRLGEYGEAIEHFNAAREVVERHLDRKAIFVYLYLGHSYYHSKDFERAKKTYADLSNTHLTDLEQRRCRELYLYRARIHLRDREPELAYRDLIRFVRLGGEIPTGSLKRQYAWLLATYANFMPLDRIHHWKYVDTATGKSYRLLVKERGAGDDYIVERHEDQTVSEEKWSKDGVFLLKTIGKDVWRIPINLEPARKNFPQAQYSRREGNVTYFYKTEIQSNNETVVLPGDKEVHNCIKVRLWRRKTEGGKSNPSFLVYMLYFAPDIGEVKRDVILNNIKLSEIVLSGFAYKSETLGN